MVARGGRPGMKGKLKGWAPQWAPTVTLCALLACGGDKRGEHHEPGDGPGSEEPGKGPGGPGHDPDAPPERDPWVPPPDASFGARVPPPEVDVPTRGVGQS